MTALETTTTTITTFADRLRFDEAELAAVAFPRQPFQVVHRQRAIAV